MPQTVTGRKNPVMSCEPALRGFASACVAQKPGVRHTTSSVVLVLLVEVEVELLVDDDVLLEVELLLELLVEEDVLLDVLVDVVVVSHAFVQSSLLFEFPSSQASPDDACTTPSPQIVHGLASCRSRQTLSLASAAGHPPVGFGGVPQFVLPAGQH